MQSSAHRQLCHLLPDPHQNTLRSVGFLEIVTDVVVKWLCYFMQFTISIHGTKGDAR